MPRRNRLSANTFLKLDGTVVTRFTPIAPYDTPGAVENLCNAYEQAITHSGGTNAMTKQETYDYLTTHGVDFEVTEHPAVFNMAEVAEIPLPHPEADAKNLFVRDDKKLHYYMITVQGDKRVDLKKFRKQHGLRSLSFASVDDLGSILDLIPGAVTPLGILNDQERRVELYLDAAFSELIGVHPNDNTATVWMKTVDLIRIITEHGNRVSVVEI